MKKNQWPLAPLVLGFILGDMFEGVLHQSLSMSGGSVSIFWNHPIAIILMAFTEIFEVLRIKVLRRTPKVLLVEEDKI